MKTFTLLAVLATLGLPAAAGGSDPCDATAKLQRQAAQNQLRADALTNIAICKNLSDPADQDECLFEARLSWAEELELLEDQYEARLDLCDLLGGGLYDPAIDPDDFTDIVDNPYLPFPEGAQWEYVSETDEGTETILITVLEERREILGVECISVRDVVYLEGEPVEDTIDWFAQDDEGNVWYFGEISFNYDDGFVEDVEGSWLSGVDGAKPGIVMLGDPMLGVTYRQEWLLNEAEDAATVLGVGVTVDVGGTTYLNCVETHDFLPPEPDASETKYYAPGIGFIYETKADSDETVELVSYSL